MIPPGFIAGCYFDPISTDRPNQYLPHMNMRQTPMAYSPQTNYLYAVGCVNPAWMKRATTGWEFIQPTRLPGQKQYGVLATVRDSGPGLNPDSLERLFDPFFTTKPGGLGMGLSICRSIVEAHGGRVWASRPAGPGATAPTRRPCLATCRRTVWTKACTACLEAV